MAAVVLELRSVVAGYGAGDILKGVDLDIQAGTVTCLIGPNGAGKSTVLKTVSGLLRPRLGTVTFRGEQLGRLTPEGPAAARNRARAPGAQPVPGDDRPRQPADGRLRDQGPEARPHPGRAGDGGVPDLRQAGQGPRRLVVGRGAEAGRAGPDAGPRPAADPARRAVDRPGPEVTGPRVRQHPVAGRRRRPHGAARRAERAVRDCPPPMSVRSSNRASCALWPAAPACSTIPRSPACTSAPPAPRPRNPADCGERLTMSIPTQGAT